VTEPELLDEGPISLEIFSLEIGEQATTGADHLEQTLTTVVVLGVLPEVVGEVV